MNNEIGMRMLLVESSVESMDCFIGGESHEQDIQNRMECCAGLLCGGSGNRKDPSGEEVFEGQCAGRLCYGGGRRGGG